VCSYCQGDSPRTLAILILSSDGPSKKRSDILSCLQKRQKPQGQRDRLQQLKAAHLVKIRALRLQHVARLHTVLCCLQLAAPKKPYLPGCLVRRIAIMAYNKEEHAYKYAPHNPQREQLFHFCKSSRAKLRTRCLCTKLLLSSHGITTSLWQMIHLS